MKSIHQLLVTFKTWSFGQAKVFWLIHSLMDTIWQFCYGSLTFSGFYQGRCNRNASGAGKSNRNTLFRHFRQWRTAPESHFAFPPSKSGGERCLQHRFQELAQLCGQRPRPLASQTGMPLRLNSTLREWRKSRFTRPKAAVNALHSRRFAPPRQLTLEV